LPGCSLLCDGAEHQAGFAVKAASARYIIRPQTCGWMKNMLLPWNKNLRRSCMIALIYAITAFVVLHFFMLKNGWFRELSDTGFSFDRMVSFTADRPFAYRVLMPALINGGAFLFPKDFQHAHRLWFLENSPLAAYAKNKLFMHEGLAVKIHLGYFYLFLSLIFLLYAIRFITNQIYSFPPLFSDACPAIGLLFLPLTFTWGGHIYDFPELLLAALCLICIIKKKWLYYYPLFVLAILNKEVDVLLVLFFIAFCQDTMSKKNIIKHGALQVFIGASLLLWVRFVFADNPVFPGLNDYWKHNIQYWLNPRSYFLFWDAYHIGLPISPRGSNIFLIVFTAFFVFHKWKNKPLEVKRLFIYTAIFNIPLFLYLGWADEIRTLSLMFPAIYLLAVYSLYRLIYPGGSDSKPQGRATP
jgi:hypothetical protein